MSDSVALYRKYRGHKLSDIVGQEHITDTLDNAIKNNRVSHAYLFTGPHGVGKTSVARILAHAINDLKYDGDSEYLDIIEIDAASNRRIDEIRDLREKVHIAPSSAKYKVYIIDEVHMLTKEAFNALLKTLEEPPKHVVFILATTEAHKLPETIISRTQRHTFKPIQKTAAIEHLKSIAKKENVKITDDALSVLAEHGKGSFRDSISLLDQIASNNTRETIEKDDVESMLGLAPSDIVSSIISACRSNDIEKIIELFDKAQENGVSAPILAQQLVKQVRDNQRLEGIITDQDIDFIENLLTVSTSQRSDIKLEAVLFRYARTFEKTNRIDDTETQPSPKKVIKESTRKEVVLEKPVETKQPAENGDEKQLSKAEWNKITDKIKTSNNALHAVMRMARATIVDGETLNLYFKFPFHKKQASEKKNMTIIAETASDVLSLKINVQCLIDEKGEPENKEETGAKSIIDTFGGGEVI